MSFTESLEDLVEQNGNKLLSIHPSWERVRLVAVAQILNGFAFKSDKFSKDDGLPLIRIRDVRSDTTDTRYFGEYEDTYLVEPGSLLVGMDGDFHAAIWRGPTALLNQRVCKITPNEEHYDLRFLSYALPGYLNAINAHTSAITVKHLSSRTVADIPLPLPSLDEQRRIVDEIEKQFTRLDAAVEALRRVQANLKRYRASVLKAACEGRLVPTEADLACAEGRDFESADVLLQRIHKERRRKWEEDQLGKFEAKGKPPKDEKWKAKYKEPAAPDVSELPELPEGWCWASADQIATKIVDGTHHTPTYIEAGVPFISVKDVRDGRLHFDDCKFISTEEHSELSKRCKPEQGDLLITKSGTIGRTAIVSTDMEFSLFVSVALVKFVSSILPPEWVEIAFGAWLQRIHVARAHLINA